METTVVSSVKGLCYRTPNDIAAARLLDKGDPIILQREPDNAQDRFAIKILTRPGNFIGYVDQEFSESLSAKFEYLRAKVLSIRNTEIPFISIEITISDEPMAQPQIEHDANRLTAQERMMVLNTTISYTKPPTKIPEGYHVYGCQCSWTEELPRENVLRAKRCMVGEPIKLVNRTPSRYPGRIEIYTADDILIGFIDEEANEGLAQFIDQISGAFIESNESLGRITCRLYLPSEAIPSLPWPHNYCDYPFKEVNTASYMAQNDPMGALDMIQYAIDHEKGITAKEVALKCYWHLKDWAARREMALRMLSIIDSMNPDEYNPFTYRLLKTRRYEELRKIIETCEKRLRSKKKIP